jgi:hypothetical protein
MCDLCGADVTASNQALHAIRCCDYMKEPSGEPHQAAAGDATTGCAPPLERAGDHRQDGRVEVHGVSSHTTTDGESA